MCKRNSRSFAFALLSGLNPCCNGICVKVGIIIVVTVLFGLNPCCNGICVKAKGLEFIINENPS